MAKGKGGAGSGLNDGRFVQIEHDDDTATVKIWVAGGYHEIDLNDERLTKPGQRGSAPLIRAEWHAVPEYT